MIKAFLHDPEELIDLEPCSISFFLIISNDYNPVLKKMTTLKLNENGLPWAEIGRKASR